MRSESASLSSSPRLREHRPAPSTSEVLREGGLLTRRWVYSLDDTIDAMLIERLMDAIEYLDDIIGFQDDMCA